MVCPGQTLIFFKPPEVSKVQFTKLLGIESNDIDFCFVCLDDHKNLSIEDGFQFMKEWLIHEGYIIFLETPSMLTIRAKIPENTINCGKTADFVLARKEISYDDNSRQPIVTLGTLEDDLISFILVHEVQMTYLNQKHNLMLL
jgi:hypothetical protein